MKSVSLMEQRWRGQSEKNRQGGLPVGNTLDNIGATWEVKEVVTFSELEIRFILNKGRKAPVPQNDPPVINVLSWA